MKDDLGDRMKVYEQAECSRSAMPLLPVCARLDGRCFSSFTRGLERPYDVGFSGCMELTASYLVEQTHARIGYTQSDEITLIFMVEDYKSQIMFNGKFQKLVSVLAAMATARFNGLLSINLAEKADQLPVFDCRVWNVPNRGEAANVLLWREQDATRNSISMVAQSLYSHKELHGKSTKQMQEMIFERGKNWNDEPTFFKRGSYFRRITEMRDLTEAELMKIPEAHHPEGPVERSRVVRFHFPTPLSRIMNRVQVLFDNCKPVFAEDNDG